MNAAMDLSLCAFPLEQDETLIRAQHLDGPAHRVVRHLLRVAALGKFFAEKVEAGKPEDVRVAAQRLGPSTPNGEKKARQHQRHRQTWQEKSESRAAQQIAHRSQSRQGSLLSAACHTTA